MLMLLLQHAFALHYRRVEWKVHSPDAWMRDFISKAGFFLEGVMKKHDIVRNQSRDTACYAVLNSDWPAVQAKLKRKVELSMEGAGAQGAEQRQRQGQGQGSNKKGD